MQIKDDKAYVECLKSDDFTAFDALFHKYSASLYAFALSITIILLLPKKLPSSYS